LLTSAASSRASASGLARSSSAAARSALFFRKSRLSRLASSRPPTNAAYLRAAPAWAAARAGASRPLVGATAPGWLGRATAEQNPALQCWGSCASGRRGAGSMLRQCAQREGAISDQHEAAAQHPPLHPVCATSERRWRKPSACHAPSAGLVFRAPRSAWGCGPAPALQAVLQQEEHQRALARAPGRHALQRLLLEEAQLAVRQQRGDEDLAQRIDGLRQGALTRATWPRLTPRACSMPEHQPNIGLVRLRSPELRRLSSGMHASAGEPSSTCCHDRLCRPGATPGRPWRARRCACRPT